MDKILPYGTNMSVSFQIVDEVISTVHYGNLYGQPALISTPIKAYF